MADNGEPRVIERLVRHYRVVFAHSDSWYAFRVYPWSLALNEIERGSPEGLPSALYEGFEQVNVFPDSVSRGIEVFDFPDGKVGAFESCQHVLIFHPVLLEFGFELHFLVLHGNLLFCAEHGGAKGFGRTARGKIS
jgi:hypothetical protein